MHAVVWGWLSYARRDDLRTGHFDRPQVLHLFESTSKPTCFFFKPGIFSRKNKSYAPLRCSVLMLMDFWQLELDTLTVGSVVGVVELKGQQCMSFDRFPSWGVGRNFPPVFGGIFPKVEKNGRQYYPEQKKTGRKKQGDFV